MQVFVHARLFNFQAEEIEEMLEGEGDCDAEVSIESEQVGNGDESG